VAFEKSCALHEHHRRRLGTQARLSGPSSRRRWSRPCVVSSRSLIWRGVRLSVSGPWSSSTSTCGDRYGSAPNGVEVVRRGGARACQPGREPPTSPGCENTRPRFTCRASGSRT
jgi:hypothetical protein